MNTRLWRYAWERLRTRWPETVAARWPDTPEALAAALGCDLDHALRVGWCRAPRPGAEGAWARHVARTLGLDPRRVAAVGARLTAARRVR